jgi:tetratricopeptide (TPR) repeat protein
VNKPTHLRLVAVQTESSAEVAAPRFWAFISYSHHDKVIAKKLQRRLETYRVPRRLVGRANAHGTVPARISPIFRDRDDLHAGADLKASVQSALQDSRWLIVLCTPDAARSPWVNREIIEFKRLHGERHVLALIAAGEPFASNTPGREAEECFPPALRRALDAAGDAEGEPLEPIAADLRAEGDGPRRAPLKLLAGIIGVGFDELVRRDLQRRIRWLSGLAIAAVAGLVAFAGLTIMAIQARNEAQQQRLKAEGLIEFMLGDLRKKLEPVGRLEVLDSVGEETLAYYDSEAANKLDATALGHRSRAMHLIGEIRDLRGNPAEAQVAFEQAEKTTAQLLAKAPNDAQRVFDHAQSVFWVGYAAWERNDGKTAEAKFRDYLALAEHLVTLDPLNAKWNAEVAFANVNLGMVQLGMGHPEVALRALQSAGKLLTSLIPQNPDLRFELAQNYGWQADAYALLGDYANALREQQQKLTLFKSLPGGDKNLTAKRGILSSLNEISMYELAMGNVSDAESHSHESLKVAATLVEEDPNNVFWRGGACIAQLRLVAIQLSQDRIKDAQQAFTRASDCVTQFSAVGTTALYDRVMIESRALSLGAALTSEDSREALSSRIEAFMAQTMSQLSANTPDRAKLSLELANLSLAQGVLLSRHDAPAARAAWQRAVTLLTPFADLQDSALLTPLARAHFYLGDAAGARTLVARIQSTDYRHPAYVALVKQLQTTRQ